MAVAEYKKRGGKYEGRKDPHNSLHEWTEERLGHQVRQEERRLRTSELWLPKQAREHLS